MHVNGAALVPKLERLGSRQSASSTSCQVGALAGAPDEAAVQTVSLELRAHRLRVASPVAQEVAKCQMTDAHLSLDDVCRSYRRLKDQCREEYLMYNLPAAALSQARQDLSCILKGRDG